MAVRRSILHFFLLSFVYIIFVDIILCNNQKDDSFAKYLNDGDFEHLTQASSGATTGDWLVLFNSDKDTCDDCQSAKKIFEGLAEHWHSRKNIAIIDGDKNPELVKRFNLESFPDIILFRLGYRYQYSGGLSYPEVESFLDSGFQSFKKEKVLPPSSGWDLAMESLSRTITGCFTPSCCWTKSLLIFGAIMTLGFCLSKLFNGKPIKKD